MSRCESKIVRKIDKEIDFYPNSFKQGREDKTKWRSLESRKRAKMAHLGTSSSGKRNDVFCNAEEAKSMASANKGISQQG